LTFKRDIYGNFFKDLAGPPGLKLIWNSHTKNSEVLKAEKYASNDIKDKNICCLYELMVGRHAKVHPLGFHCELNCCHSIFTNEDKWNYR
jgi:hypothetical protein